MIIHVSFNHAAYGGGFGDDQKVADKSVSKNSGIVDEFRVAALLRLRDQVCFADTQTVKNVWQQRARGVAILDRDQEDGKVFSRLFLFVGGFGCSLWRARSRHTEHSEPFQSLHRTGQRDLVPQ